jgi:hypothetical protein
MRIIVLGYMIRGPIGGLAWHHLQYAAGLKRLGHEVYFLEDSDDYPSCYDPSRDTTGTDPGYGLAFAADAFARVGLHDAWAFYDAWSSRWLGPASSRVDDLCASAELLLNVSGVNPLRSWYLRVPERVLIDTDPVFTQIRHLTDPYAREQAERHTRFFSFGENIGTPGCRVVDDGFRWRPTRQPVVMDLWPVVEAPAGAPFTTVMQWESYPAREFAGARYGNKSESFAPYLDLPGRTSATLELAIGSPTAPRPMLSRRGWRIRDPLEIAPDPWKYQQYIRGSRGEFSVAKQGYVVSASGWFSERSACYLASGRPVVVQDTGFSRWLPTGAGVFCFATLDEAVAALDEVEERHDFHCRAAREIAEAYFDSRKVLQELLEAITSTEPAEAHCGARTVPPGSPEEAPAGPTLQRYGASV